MRGPHVFREYWRNPEATAETLTTTAGCTPATSAPSTRTAYLTITGRKKDIIITAGGKNLSPANMENDLRSPAGSPRPSCTATAGRSRSR